ncbi:zinc finger protein [Plasmodium brasilianum]|uniref:Zinc finger protein, putative n=2 Tax=Plasmodium (Plasmodium) TaxID=418103 RepID=A0A1A8X033_PLAMA|nr:zinc finger protein, putative [Plasmodium malariae]KAI4838933.1 zinc finger protein [Plasmodium brasilianum]SBS97514.1 zinc finger protein, putative [Plasmodium malariae]SCN12278.1 zinc finger protein, putative [Plasmodium malariae]
MNAFASGPGNYRNRTLNVTSKCLNINYNIKTIEDGASIFCPQCNIPFNSKIRINPCYHIICNKCYELCVQQQSCLLCNSEINDVDFIFINDKIFICPYNDCKKGYFNEKSYNYHIYFKHQFLKENKLRMDDSRSRSSRSRSSRSRSSSSRSSSISDSQHGIDGLSLTSPSNEMGRNNVFIPSSSSNIVGYNTGDISNKELIYEQRKNNMNNYYNDIGRGNNVNVTEGKKDSFPMEKTNTTMMMMMMMKNQMQENNFNVNSTVPDSSFASGATRTNKEEPIIGSYNGSSAANASGLDAGGTNASCSGFRGASANASLCATSLNDNFTNQVQIVDKWNYTGFPFKSNFNSFNIPSDENIPAKANNESSKDNQGDDYDNLEDLM